MFTFFLGLLAGCFLGASQSARLKSLYASLKAKFGSK